MGLVHKWKQARYTSYKELSLTEEQAKLAKDLLLGGDFEYYYELEELSAEDKPTFYKGIKEELKMAKGWRARDILRKLIEVEDDVDEMMEFVREEPRYIEYYAARLADKFQDEMVSIYREYILTVASSTSNRKDYKQVGKLLGQFKAVAGKEICDELIQELKEVYSKRPAFLDELSKVN